MNAIDLINLFGRNATVTRYAAATYSNGRITKGTTSTFSIKISIQPIKGRELLNFPEAQRNKQLSYGYTATELRTVNEATKTSADRLTDGTRTFEVQAVEFWDSAINTIAPHYKVLLAEVNQ